jgi:hypothetical protein
MLDQVFLCFNREERRGDAKLPGWSDMMNGFAAESLRHPNFSCLPRSIYCSIYCSKSALKAVMMARSHISG